MESELIPVELFSKYSIDNITSFPCLTSTSPTIKFQFTCTITQSLWEESIPKGSPRLLEANGNSLMQTNVSMGLPLFRRHGEAFALIKDQIKHWPINDQFFENLIASAHEKAEEALKPMPPNSSDLYVQCHVKVVRRIVLQPAGFLEDKKITSSRSSCCSICLEDLFEWGASMPCQHIFHRDCILKWLGINSSCPVCRFQIPIL